MLKIAKNNWVTAVKLLCIMIASSLAISCTSQIEAQSARLIKLDGKMAIASFTFRSDDEARRLIKNGKFYVGIGSCDGKSIMYYPADAKQDKLKGNILYFAIWFDEDIMISKISSQCVYAKTTGYSLSKLETSFVRIQGSRSSY